MQTLIDKFGTSATYLIAIAGAAILLLVLFLLARAMLGARIRMSSGRARQPRLGVVDAFDLDRQRQLVLVRRDNVEHLVMIGGPNDLLIESTIIRTAAANEVRPRVTTTLEEPTVAAPARTAAITAAPPSIDELVHTVAPPAPQPIPAPPPAPVAVRPVPVPPPPTRVEPAPSPPPPPVPRPVPKAEMPVPPPPAPPAPPPSPVAPLRPAPVPVPAAPESSRGVGTEPPKKRFDFGRLMANRSAEPARPSQEKQNQAEGPTATPPLPVPPPVATATPSAPATPSPNAGPAPEKAQPSKGDPIDALEQEMAKLLGRSSQSSS